MTKLTEIRKNRNSLVSTEFLPPKNTNLTDLVNKTLRVAGVIDSVSIPDLKANSRTIPMHRMNAFYAAMRLRDLTGVETVYHLTPRDLNRNAIAGLLLAAAHAGLQNVLVVGGDRYDNAETRTLSKNVYDFAGATDLIRGIRNFQAQLEPEHTGFCIIVGTDPTVIYTNDKKRIEREVVKLVDRQDAGAELVQTQPVFDLRYFEFLDSAKEHGLKIPALVGILPLRGRSDAVEVERRYGITIPNDIKSALKEDMDQTGTRFACELAVNLVRNGVQTLHIYPRENCNFLLDVTKAAFGRRPSEDIALS